MKAVRVLNSKHLVFPHENPAQLMAVFPQAKVAPINGVHYGAVDNTLENAQILSNMGYTVQSPIRTQYNWPVRSGWKPRDSQVITAEFLTLNMRANCHSSMRVGKTLATLWAIDYLQTIGLVKKALIVGPLSSLELAWADNIFFNFPRRKYAVLHGSADKRRELLKQDCDIYILNHDGVGVIYEDLMKRQDINCIVVDEVHEYKNPQTDKWKLLNRIVNKRGVTSWVWGLSGTPTPQAPTDAYGQAKLIKPENLNGLPFTSFKNEVMFKVGMFKWVPRNGSEAMVSKVLSPSIRFTRSEVTDIEPCLIERHAELSAQQKLHLKELINDAVTSIDDSTVSAVNAAILVQKIVQVSCGVVYGTNQEFLEIDFGPRLKVLEELIEGNDEKVLVFVPFTGALEAVARELRKRWPVEVIQGGMSNGKRNRIYRAFQTTPEPHIIVAHPGCMSYSLELTKASLVIWYAPPPGGNKIYQQACARIDGGGQTAKIDIAHISATSTERKAFAVVQGKATYQDVVLDLLKGKI